MLHTYKNNMKGSSFNILKYCFLLKVNVTETTAHKKLKAKFFIQNSQSKINANN